MLLRQRTIKKSISLSGKGLHSGKKVKVTLNPAPANHGIVFRRVDLKKTPLIPALAANVVDTTMATTLGKDGAKISTVEHLLSAIMGFQIDNLQIDVDGAEIPILDGSAKEFAEALVTVGAKEQKELKKFLMITKPVAVRQKDRFSYLFPAKEFKITCRIEFSNKCIGKQRFDMSFPFVTSGKTSSNKNGNGNGNGNGHQPKPLNPTNMYFDEIGSARTFGFLEEVSMLQRKGLALGGGLDNAIVVNKDSIMNKEGLRWDDEFVRHKVLDAMGDLALMGMQVIGHLVTYRSGHCLHHKLVQKTLKSKDSWKVMTFDKVSSSKEDFLLSRSFDEAQLAPAF